MLKLVTRVVHLSVMGCFLCEVLLGSSCKGAYPRPCIARSYDKVVLNAICTRSTLYVHCFSVPTAGIVYTEASTLISICEK